MAPLLNRSGRQKSNAGGSSSHAVNALLQNLRSTIDVLRLPRDVTVSLRHILEAIEERQEQDRADARVDMDVLQTIVDELPSVLEMSSRIQVRRAASMPTLPEPRLSSDGRQVSVKLWCDSCMMEEDLMGDLWQDCEDLATEDLFDFFAESLRHSSCDAEGSKQHFLAAIAGSSAYEDRKELPPAAFHSIPKFSPRCCSSGSECHCNFSFEPPKLSPKRPSLASNSTLPSLGNLERLSMASTRSSLQSSVRQLSTTSTLASSRLSDIANPGSARTILDSARRLESARGPDTARNLIGPSGNPDTARSMRQKWEGLRARLDDCELQPQSARGRGLTWQQMWREKITATRRLSSCQESR